MKDLEDLSRDILADLYSIQGGLTILEKAWDNFSEDESLDLKACIFSQADLTLKAITGAIDKMEEMPTTIFSLSRKERSLKNEKR